MESDRRWFLKLAAMASATAAASGARAISLPVLQDQPGDDVTWDKAPCRFCGTGCHVRVGVRDGRVVAIAGDPLADVNKGLLCVKGYHVGSILYGQDRLTQPLLRRGDGFEPISWEEAIDIVAERIMQAPDRFAFYGSGQWTIPEGYAAQKFMKGGLSNNHIDPNARLCMSSAVTGFIATYGVDEPAGCYQDLDECDVLITWGNNPAEMHPVLFSRIIDRRAPSDKGGDIDTIWVQVTKPGHSLPNLHKLFKAREGLEDKFLIVSEVYPTATTELADLVLPAAMWVEKNGIFGNSERRTQQWFRQVMPSGQARDDAWMTIAVAHRLHELGHPGMKDQDGNFIFTARDDAGRAVPVWEWEHYYDVNVDRVLYEEYRKFSRYKHKDLAPYQDLSKARGLR